MQPKFWLERWERNQIGFHQAEHNKLLLEFWPELGVDPESCVFVPLCGKSLDMRWLESAGHEVLGVELSDVAIDAYFAERGERVEQRVVERFVSHEGSGTRILQGDFFDLTSPLLAGVQAVFDRASLVALPPDMRFRYIDHLLRIVPDGCRILLITFEYDQALVSGPPHAVFGDEVEAHYGSRCDIELLEAFVTSVLPPHFVEAGVGQAIESVYRITKRD